MSPRNGLLERLARLVVGLANRFVRRFNKPDHTIFAPGSPDDPADTLYGRLIKTYAPGRSFADICCMWAMHGKTAYYAEELGATKVTAFDGMDATPEFEEERRRRNSRIRFVQGDLDKRDLERSIGKHDVVWCTGLLYHTPEPFRVISDLLSIAGEYAILGSKTAPEVPGMPNMPIFLPGLGEAERKALMPYWGKNLRRPFGNLPAWDYEWWWLLTGSTIASMIEAHRGWKVVGIHRRTRAGLNDDCVVVARRLAAAAASLTTAAAPALSSAAA